MYPFPALQMRVLIALLFSATALSIPITSRDGEVEAHESTITIAINSSVEDGTAEGSGTDDSVAFTNASDVVLSRKAASALANIIQAVDDVVTASEGSNRSDTLNITSMAEAGAALLDLITIPLKMTTIATDYSLTANEACMRMAMFMGAFASTDNETKDRYNVEEMHHECLKRRSDSIEKARRNVTDEVERITELIESFRDALRNGSVDAAQTIGQVLVHAINGDLADLAQLTQEKLARSSLALIQTASGRRISDSLQLNEEDDTITQRNSLSVASVQASNETENLPANDEVSELLTGTKEPPLLNTEGNPDDEDPLVGKAANEDYDRLSLWISKDILAVYKTVIPEAAARFFDVLAAENVTTIEMQSQLDESLRQPRFVVESIVRRQIDWVPQGPMAIARRGNHVESMFRGTLKGLLSRGKIFQRDTGDNSVQEKEDKVEEISVPEPSPLPPINGGSLASVPKAASKRPPIALSSQEEAEQAPLADGALPSIPEAEELMPEEEATSPSSDEEDEVSVEEADESAPETTTVEPAPSDSRSEEVSTTKIGEDSNEDKTKEEEEENPKRQPAFVQTHESDPDFAPFL